MRGLQLPTALCALLLAMPTGLSAQAVRNATEHVNNERQIVRAKAQLARDQKEIEEFEDLLARVDALAAAGASDGLKRVHSRIRTAMEREYDQARRKVRQAGREVGQSRREAAAEHREAKRTGRLGDRLQAADDRRDLRDDRLDWKAAARRAERMRAIIGQSEALQPAITRGDTGAFVKDRRLMGEFLELLRGDLRATATELGEDRGERREDRRERLTDRNE